ncbi:MAG: DUF4364 family protein [Ruminococcaceae bacterium]|nr:DUF4364 family protein [Oscillospiraceae bacterium]
MQAPLQKKTEIKVYILYVMKNIGYPVSYQRLNDTITADEPVSAFDFTECFSELLDTGNIEPVDLDGTQGFMITERGINVADNLLYMLIPGVQRIALASAARLLSFDQRGAELSVRVRETEGGYRLFFTVTEKGRTVFSLELFCENREQLEQMDRNLRNDPESVYRAILSMLSGQINYFMS